MENLLAKDLAIVVKSTVPFKTTISIMTKDNTIHKISLMADSRLRIVEALSLNLILDASDITIMLLLPPTIVPNRREYKGDTFGITKRYMNNPATMALNANPAAARTAALGLSEKTWYMFMVIPPSNNMKTKANAAK
jgi:hypothetical protein